MRPCCPAGMDLSPQDALGGDYRASEVDGMGKTATIARSGNSRQVMPWSFSSSNGSTSSRCETPTHERQNQHPGRLYAFAPPLPAGRRLSDQQQHQLPHRHQQQHEKEHPQPQQQHDVFIRGADRRSLQNLRVIRRTLVYAIGLSPNFAQVNTLKQPEYFGQYGDIAKLVINHHHGVAEDDPRHGSASAYITFRRSEDAWAAICSVDGFRLMGRTIRASFGTTKYCNSFLRNVPCNNPDCLYLHELGDQDDRFTKDEVQLGLARHGSSFAFKEEVLGSRGADDRGTGRPKPTNPVFPPPCPFPPASYEREGVRYQREGELHHQLQQRQHHPSGACGHESLPAQRARTPCAHACRSCGDRSGGGCGRSIRHVAAASETDARWAGAAPAGVPSSLLEVGGGGGLGGDDRPRPRRRRGQRGRRTAGSGGGGCEPAANLGSGSVSSGRLNEFGERMVGPTGGLKGSAGVMFTHPADVVSSSANGYFDFGGGGGSRSNGNSCRHASESAQAFGGSDRSTCSGCNGGLGQGCGSPAMTSETLSNTPPVEHSQLEGFYKAQMWTQGQYEQQRPPSASPSLFGAAGMGDSADHQQLLQMQLQQQTQQRYQDAGSDPQERELLAIAEVRQGLSLLQRQRLHHHQRPQQERYDEVGSDQRASIAALQQQVQKLQRYFEHTSGGRALAGEGDGLGGSGPDPLQQQQYSLGAGFRREGSSGGRAGSTRSYSDDLSFAEERLAATHSWGDDENDDGNDAASGSSSSNPRAFLQREESGGGSEGLGSGALARVQGESFSSSGSQGEGGGDAVFWSEAAAPANSFPLCSFGPLSMASTASQVEASQWRRATPRLFA